MSLIDWCIVLALFAVVVYAAFKTNKYVKSVADFLVAGRVAGRYIVAVVGGISGFGAVTAIANFEQFYKAGFSVLWWGIILIPMSLIVALSGWGWYRFRQTRAMTFAQYIEARYSKRLRIFSGLLCYISGVINFGIFPAIGAKFFLYFCGIPEYFEFMGMTFSSYVLILLFLISFSTFLTTLGGQITVMVTDVLQGIFVYISFGIIVFFLLTKFDWIDIGDTLATAPKDASLVNPFKTGGVEDFNIWFYLITIFMMWYGRLSWQGNMGNNAAPINAHESRMAGVIGIWKGFIQTFFVVMIPIIAFVVMHHSNYVEVANSVNNSLVTIKDDMVQYQAIVPLVLTKILPPGLLGLFCAIMLAAAVTTMTASLHSWGSIFFQDVIMPFYKTALGHKKHIGLLRISIFVVAVIAFFFSLYFKQTEHILLFMAVTGAIFMGGAGSMLLGGLYWRKGSTLGAWAAMITGAVISLAGMIGQQIYENFPLNGMWLALIASLTSIFAYVIVSLIQNKDFDLDKLLHRGKYAIESDIAIGDGKFKDGLRKFFFMGEEFTRRDRILFVLSYAWIFLWTLIFVVGTIYNLIYEINDSKWFKFWRFYMLAHLAIGIVVTIWLSVGGIKDMVVMFRKLAIMKRNHLDDGRVAGQHNLADEKIESVDSGPEVCKK